MRPGHSRASTVDPGAAYDVFAVASHPESGDVRARARAIRLALRLLTIRRRLTLENALYQDACVDTTVK